MKIKQIYQNLCQSSKKIRICLIIGLGLILLLTLSYIAGYRFSSLQASKASRLVDNESILLADIKHKIHHVYFYENKDNYRSIITKYQFPFWHTTGVNFYANKTQDDIKLVGWVSTNFDHEDPLMYVPVINYDENVSYIEMGTGEDRIRNEMPLGKVIIFSWNKNIEWGKLNPIAYSKDGKALFKLRNKRVGNTIYGNEIRWFPIE